MTQDDSPLTREAVTAIFDRRRLAWLESDAEAYMALWVDDMRIELPGRDPIVGKHAYAKLIDESMRSMRPKDWVFHHLAIDGDHVLAEWTIEGEFIANSKRVRWRGMSVSRMQGGLICEWREYWDPSAMRR